MCKIILTCLLFTAFFVNISTFNVVYAQSYTTRAKTGNNIVDSSQGASRCTNEDLNTIRNFDRTAKRNVRAFKRNMEEMQSMRKEILKNHSPSASTLTEVKDFSRKRDKVYDFFESDEYNAMKPVYARCGLKIPTPNWGVNMPFWVNDNVLEDTGICPTCGNAINKKP